MGLELQPYEFTTSTLDGFQCQIHASATLPPIPLQRKFGEPQSRYGRCKKRQISTHAGIRTTTHQPPQQVKYLLLLFRHCSPFNCIFTH